MICERHPGVPCWRQCEPRVRQAFDDMEALRIRRTESVVGSSNSAAIGVETDVRLPNDTSV